MSVVRKTLVAASLAAASTLTLAVSAAFANPSPNGPGQPGTGGTTPPSGIQTSCQNYTTTPGNSASNNGAPYSPTGHSGTVYAGNGPGSAHSNSGNAVSEYDIACYQQTVHNH